MHRGSIGTKSRSGLNDKVTLHLCILRFKAILIFIILSILITCISFSPPLDYKFLEIKALSYLYLLVHRRDSMCVWNRIFHKDSGQDKT